MIRKNRKKKDKIISTLPCIIQRMIENRSIKQGYYIEEIYWNKIEHIFAKDLIFHKTNCILGKDSANRSFVSFLLKDCGTLCTLTFFQRYASDETRWVSVMNGHVTVDSDFTLGAPWIKREAVEQKFKRILSSDYHQLDFDQLYKAHFS